MLKSRTFSRTSFQNPFRCCVKRQDIEPHQSQPGSPVIVHRPTVVVQNFTPQLQKANEEQVIFINQSRLYKAGNEGGVSIYSSGRTTKIIKSLPASTQLEALPNYPHLLRPTEQCMFNNHIILFYDYIKGKNINELSQTTQDGNLKFIGLSSDMKMQCLKEIAGAVKALHDKNLVHGDIAPRNIMFDQENNRFVLIDTDHVKKNGSSIARNDYDPRLFEDGQVPDTITKEHDIYQLNHIFEDLFESNQQTLTAFTEVEVDNPEELKSNYTQELNKKTSQLKRKQQNKAALEDIKKTNFASYFQVLINENNTEEIEKEVYSAIFQCGIRDEEDQYDLYQLFLSLINETNQNKMDEFNQEIQACDGKLEGSKLEIMEKALLNITQKDPFVENLQRISFSQRRHSKMISPDSGVNSPVSPRPSSISTSSYLAKPLLFQPGNRKNIRFSSFSSGSGSSSTTIKENLPLNNFQRNRQSSSSSIEDKARRPSATKIILDEIKEQQRRESLFQLGIVQETFV